MKRILCPVPSGHRRAAAGEGHPRARHTDAVVEAARAAHIAGESYRSIAAWVSASESTIARWVRGERRKPAISMQWRWRTVQDGHPLAESLALNDQLGAATPAPAPDSSDSASAQPVNLTVNDRP